MGPVQKNQTSSVVRHVDWGDFGCRVEPSLTVGEILQWDKRRVPTSDAVKRTVLHTAAQFQAIRSAWGKPLGVTQKRLEDLALLQELTTAKALSCILRPVFWLGSSR